MNENLKDKLVLPKKSRKKIWWAILFFLIIIFAISLIDFYSESVSKKISEPIFAYFPAPIATVDGLEIIYSNQLLRNKKAVEKSFSNQDLSSLGMRVDFRTKEGQMRLKIKEREILDKLVEDRIAILLAEKKGLAIGQKDVENELLEKIMASGDDVKNFSLNVRNVYGWSLKDFQREIVHPQFCLKKLFEYYQENIAQESIAYGKIREAQTEISSNPNQFGEIAKKYSQGESVENDGLVGWFEEDELQKEIAEKAFEIEIGKPSEIIATPLGFHIIVVEERKKTQDDKNESKNEVKLKQIFIKEEGGFYDWFFSEKKKFKMKVLMRDYVWNQESGSVEFRNHQSRKMEETIRSKSQGDPSMDINADQF